jgi:hypothetical protein
VTLQKAVNPTSSIDKFLFAGEEGVAGRTNFDVDLFKSATSIKFVAATALHVAVNVFWMDSFLHDEGKPYAGP